MNISTILPQNKIPQDLTNEELDLVLLDVLDDVKYKCLTDLFFLCTEVLGYDKMVSDVHGPICQVIQAANAAIIAQAGERCTLYNMPQAQSLYQQLNLPHSTSPKPNNNNNLRKRVDRLDNDINNNGNSSGNSCGNKFGGGGVPCKIVTQPLNSAQNFKSSLQNKHIIDNDTEYSNNDDFSINLQRLVNYDGIEFGRISDYVEIGNGMERLFLLHRGWFKTTIISIAHTIQLMLLWPEIRILITSHSLEKGSKKILGSIRQHFIANDKLRAAFPEFMPKKNNVGKIEWGTQENLTLPNRRGDCVWPESTVEIAGLTTNVIGRHYDYIKNDDLVTAESVTNESMIQKTRDFKNLQVFLFNQPEWGITDNVGTIYHFNDLWCDLDKKKITKVKVPIWNEKEEIIFHERFSHNGIKLIRDDIGDYEFFCQYLLNPVPPESQTFKPEWLERDGFYYDTAELENRPMKVSVYIDPASTKRKKSDYTAWCVIGVDDKGTKFLLDIGRDKLSTEDRTNLAIDLAQKWNVHKLFYETIGFQETDKYIIDRKKRERKYPLEVIEIKASCQSKEDRIRGLQPLYQRGDIRWPFQIQQYSKFEGRYEDMIQSLKDEMFMFPKCIHDDMLDVHSFMLRVEEYNASKPIVKKEEDAFELLRSTLCKNAKPKTNYYKRNSKVLGTKRFSVPAMRCVI